MSMKFGKVFTSVLLFFALFFTITSAYAEELDVVEQWGYQNDDGVNWSYFDDEPFIIQEDGSIFKWDLTENEEEGRSEHRFTHIGLDGKKQKEWELTFESDEYPRIGTTKTVAGIDYVWVVTSNETAFFINIYNFDGEHIKEVIFELPPSEVVTMFQHPNGHLVFVDYGAMGWEMNFNLLKMNDTPKDYYYASYSSGSITLEDGSTIGAGRKGVSRVDHNNQTIWENKEVKGNLALAGNDSLYVFSTGAEYDYDGNKTDPKYGYSSQGSTIYKLDLQTGELKWEQEYNHWTHMYSMGNFNWFISAQEVGEYVYISSIDKIQKFNKNTGKLIRSLNLPAFWGNLETTEDDRVDVIENVQITKDRVYAVIGSKVHMFDENLQEVREYDFNYIQQMMADSSGSLFVLHNDYFWDPEADRSRIINYNVSVIKNDVVKSLDTYEKYNLQGRDYDELFKGLNDEVLLYNSKKMIGFDSNGVQMWQYGTDAEASIGDFLIDKQRNRLLITYHDGTNSGLKEISIGAKKEDTVQVVEADKPWTITFNSEVNPASVTTETIYVVDEQGNQIAVDVRPGNDLRTVLVKAPIEGYESGKYELKVTTGIQSKAGVSLKEEKLHPFIVK